MPRQPPHHGPRLLALKVYHPLNQRDFRDDGLYRDGEWIKERRIRVALEKKTRFGREVQGGIWVNREWETLRMLDAAAAPVPVPEAIERTEDAILMTYVGDLEIAAPQLRSYVPDDREEAQDLFDQLVRAVELMLFNNVVHGDLSPYNVLVWEGRLTVIDLPQAVDPRKNRHAEAFLRRDLDRMGPYFERYGVHAPHGRDRERPVDRVDVRRPRPRGAPRARVTLRVRATPACRCRPASSGISPSLGWALSVVST